MYVTTFFFLVLVVIPGSSFQEIIHKESEPDLGACIQAQINWASDELKEGLAHDQNDKSTSYTVFTTCEIDRVWLDPA